MSEDEIARGGEQHSTGSHLTGVSQLSQRNTGVIVPKLGMNPPIVPNTRMMMEEAELAVTCFRYTAQRRRPRACPVNSRAMSMERK